MFRCQCMPIPFTFSTTCKVTKNTYIFLLVFSCFFVSIFSHLLVILVLHSQIKNFYLNFLYHYSLFLIKHTHTPIYLFNYYTIVERNSLFILSYYSLHHHIHDYRPHLLHLHFTMAVSSSESSSSSSE